MWFTVHWLLLLWIGAMDNLFSTTSQRNIYAVLRIYIHYASDTNSRFTVVIGTKFWKLS